MTWPFGSNPEYARPRLCPACGTLVGSSATKCHQCGASMTFSLAAVSRSLGRFMPTTSPATYGILTLSCLVYVVTLLATLRQGGAEGFGGGLGGLMNLGGIAGDVLQRMGASLPLPYNLQQPWRFVTAVFLHGSLMHIAFNMWVLMDIGPQVEEMYGTGRYLFLYVVTGIGGYVLSSAFGNFSVGGSGALLGLVGVMLAITVGRKSAGMQMLRSQLIRWLIYIAILGFVVSRAWITTRAHWRPCDRISPGQTHGGSAAGGYVRTEAGERDGLGGGDCRTGVFRDGSAGSFSRRMTPPEVRIFPVPTGKSARAGSEIWMPAIDMPALTRMDQLHIV